MVKSVVVCVCLGTLGGGLASLAVSETVTRWQAPSVDAQPAPAARTPKNAAASQPAVAAAAGPASEPQLVPAPPAAPPEHASPPEHPGAVSPTTAAAPAPASASDSSNKPRASNLFEEQRIIESARAAVSRGDAQSALATLDGYARSYAQAQFGPEALALRIEALSAKGDLTRARGLAADFRQRYPHHPLLAPVQTAVQGSPSTKR